MPLQVMIMATSGCAKHVRAHVIMEVACLGKQRKKRARSKERTALEIRKTHILLAETQRWASLNMILDDFLQWKNVEMDELASFSGGEAQKWTSNAPRSWYCHFQRLY